MLKHVLLVPAAFSVVLLTGCGEAPKPINPGEPAMAPAPAPAPAPAAEMKKEPAPVATAPKEEKPAEPAKEDLKPAPAGGATQEMSWGKTAKYTMVVPSGWKQEAAGGMRQLQVTIPKAGGDTEDAEMVGFVFPAGGGADANIQRWVQQMGGEGSLKNRKNLKTDAGAEAVVAELEGSYSAMSPRDGSPQPAKGGYMMLGVFIPSAGGEVYLKLTGPKATVEAQKAAFEKMVQSFK